MTVGPDELDPPNPGQAGVSSRQRPLGGTVRPGLLSRNRLIPVVIAIALFMDLMDSSALALALPTIGRAFHVSSIDLRLALTAYVVTVAVLVPVSGWMASQFGSRRVFVGAMALFMIGSSLCALAGSVNQLVLARILQGFGGAMMTPVGRSIVVASVDREELVRAMAWYTLPAIVAPLVGPPLAGLLLEFASWRWIFLINLPVGLAGIALILRLVPESTRELQRVFDPWGFFLSAVSILSFMGMIETRGLSGKPLGMRILGGLFAVLLGWLCVRHLLRASSPLVDLRMLRYRTLRLSLVTSWLQRVALGAMMLVLPLQLQVGFGLSPFMASQVPACGALGSVLSRLLCGAVLKWLTFRMTMMAFLLATAILTIVPAFFSIRTPLLVMCGFMFIHAVVRATFFMSANTLAYAEVEIGEIGHASVIVAIAQQLSLGLGISLGGGLLQAAGGPLAPHAFLFAYVPIALLPLGAAIIACRLPAGTGDELRGLAPR